MTLSGAVALPIASGLRFLPDKHMVRMIMELVRIRSFNLIIGDSKQSRLRRLKNDKCQLKVYNYDRFLLFCPNPTYLGIKLDRSLRFCHHLVALRKKLSLRVILLRRLVGSEWGAGAKTLHIAPLSCSTQQLSTVHQSGVATLTLSS